MNGLTLQNANANSLVPTPRHLAWVMPQTLTLDVSRPARQITAGSSSSHCPALKRASDEVHG
jgi:hypothetical protein